MRKYIKNIDTNTVTYTHKPERIDHDTHSDTTSFKVHCYKWDDCECKML